MKSRKEINELIFFLLFIFSPLSTALPSLYQASELFFNSVLNDKCIFFFMPVNINVHRSFFACMCVYACHTCTCTHKCYKIGLWLSIPIFSSFTSLCVIKMLIETKSAKRYVITCVYECEWECELCVCLWIKEHNFLSFSHTYLRLSVDDSRCLCICVCVCCSSLWCWGRKLRLGKESH